MSKKIDKRTKEYKEMKKAQEVSRVTFERVQRVKRIKEELDTQEVEVDKEEVSEPEGLGTTIEKITEATGIKKAVKWLAGDDCGCEERKFRLNRMFPKKPLCLNEGEFNHLDTFFAKTTNKVNITEQRELLKIHNRIFQRNAKESTCASCVRGMVADLRRVYNEYE
jgi:hypothetical protein